MIDPERMRRLSLLVWLAALLPALTCAEPLRIAVISDLNGAYGATEYVAAVDQAVRRIVALHPDLVISTGDMVAGQRRPHLARGEVEDMWAAFHAHVSTPIAAAGIALAVTPGNHDASIYRGFGLERAIYAEQWSPRRPDVEFLDDSEYPFRYVFSLGDTLFVSLDATAVGPLPGGQMAWLREVLSRYGARFQRRVVFGHLPLWPLAEGRESEHIGDPALQRLFEDAAVDLVLSGHHHAFYPGSKDGVLFVGQACLGAGPRRLIGAQERASQGFTWISVSRDTIATSAYAAPDFARPIDWNTLPRRIRSAAAELVRADLADNARRLRVAD